MLEQQGDTIRDRTSEATNRRIHRDTRAALDQAGDSPSRIRARLAELDREWTVDRALMLNFAIVGSLTASLTMRTLYRERKLGAWGALFFTQMAFLAHHAIWRWCPPMPVFRRLGFRSAREISDERAVLLLRLADQRE